MQKPPYVKYKSLESRNSLFNREVCVVKPISQYENAIRYGKLSLFPAVRGYGKLSLIPTVHADKPVGPPKRPPPMKFEDLPIYESPHYEYKDYIEDSKRCPKANEKLLHTYLYPSVCKYRKRIGQSVCGMSKEIIDMQKEMCNEFCKNKQKFKTFMRAEENVVIRQGVVALGTLTGMYLGSGTRGIIRKCFGGALGALAAGALCFPKETDVIFREVSYHFGKFALCIYNTIFCDNIVMRERIPCKRDLPKVAAPPKTEAKKK